MTSHFSSPSPTLDAASASPAKASAKSREKLTHARIAAMRDLVEGTIRSYKRIAEEVGVSAATVSRYAVQEGWRRAAVPARIGSPRERVTRKLWKLTERHAKALEDMPVELAC